MLKMKPLGHLLFTLFILVASCNNDDDKPTDPADVLPPATQTGEQTFGCLIDGKPFFPDRFGRGRPTAFYQFVDGAYTLGISASRRNDNPSISFNMGALDIQKIEKITYILDSFESGNFFAEYLLDAGIVLDTSTGDDGFGTMTITRFDKMEHIIPGTFEVTAYDDDGNAIRITDGRFDLNYFN